MGYATSGQTGTMQGMAEVDVHGELLPAYDGFLDFDAAKKRGLFDYASACAARGQLWLSIVTQALDEAANPASRTAVERPKCPLGVARTAE